MSIEDQIVYVIVARGNSKGVPRKNVIILQGLPLLAYKAISAQKSKYCSRLLISTEDQEIQQIASRYDVEVPFTRPKELASDSASTMDVLKHLVEYIEEKEDRTYRAVMLLEPSSPFGTGKDFDNAVRLMNEKNANLVVGVREHSLNRSFIHELHSDGSIAPLIQQIKNIKVLGRQYMPQNYTPNGSFYLIRWELIKNKNSFYCDVDKSFGYLMDEFSSIEIDSLIDLEWIKFLISNNKMNLSYWNRKD